MSPQRTIWITGLSISAWKSGPVWFFAYILKDQDQDQSPEVDRLQKTGLNQCKPVQSGFSQFSTVFRPVLTSYSLNRSATGLDWSFGIECRYNNIILLQITLLLWGEWTMKRHDMGTMPSYCLSCERVAVIHAFLWAASMLGPLDCCWGRHVNVEACHVVLGVAALSLGLPWSLGFVWVKRGLSTLSLGLPHQHWACCIAVDFVQVERKEKRLAKS